MSIPQAFLRIGKYHQLPQAHSGLGKRQKSERSPKATRGRALRKKSRGTPRLILRSTVGCCRDCRLLRGLSGLRRQILQAKNNVLRHVAMERHAFSAFAVPFTIDFGALALFLGHKDPPSITGCLSGLFAQAQGTATKRGSLSRYGNV